MSSSHLIISIIQGEPHHITLQIERSKDFGTGALKNL